MSDIISYLFKTNAIKFCKENEPFWYTSGKIGPYFINTHFIYGNENDAKELLTFIDDQLTDKMALPQNVFERVLKQYNFASDVKHYPETRYTQNFTEYNDIYGTTEVDYDLIDALYHSTILNRVIKKIASDAVPEMFKIQIVDLEGNRIPELEQLVTIYLAHLKRKHINQMFNYTLRYGTGFLYIGNKEEEQLTNMFCLHPQNLNPVMDESTGEIKEWECQTQDGVIIVPDEDLLRFAYDPDIGEIFGMSFIGKLV